MIIFTPFVFYENQCLSGGGWLYFGLLTERNIFFFAFCLDLSSLAIENESARSPTRGRSQSRDRKTLTPERLRPLPDSLEFDIK